MWQEATWQSREYIHHPWLVSMQLCLAAQDRKLGLSTQAELRAGEVTVLSVRQSRAPVLQARAPPPSLPWDPALSRGSALPGASLSPLLTPPGTEGGRRNVRKGWAEARDARRQRMVLLEKTGL